MILTGLSALMICTTADAAYIWNWSHRTGNTNGDRGKCVSNVVNSSIASSGFFQGTVDFDPTFGIVPLTSTGGSDMYVANYNTTGTLLWARRIAGTGVEESMNILTNPSNGNIYVCGRYSGSADFDPGAGTTPWMTTTGPGDFDGFLACYTATGLFVWSLDIGNGGTGRDAYYGLTFDALGSLMVCGEFTGNGAPVNFDPLGGVFNVNNYGATGTDGFIARYNPTNGFLFGGFAYPIGGTANDCARGIYVDASSGAIYTTGWFDSPNFDVDPFGAAPTIATTGGTDIFVLRWTGAAFTWVRQAGSATSNDFGMDVMFHGNNVVITGGAGLGTAVFGVNTWVVGGVGTDAFLAAYDPTTGNENWLAEFIGAGDDMGQNIASDYQGYVYCTGYFGGANIICFDNFTGAFTGPYNNVGAAGTTDIFYARYNTSGFSKDIWTTGSTSNEDCPGLFAWRNPSTGANEMFMTGSFSGTTQFDPAGGGAGSHIAAGGVARDIFLAKYNWTTPVRLMNPELNVSEFKCYPNPTNGTMYVENVMENSVVEIYSIEGRLMKSWTVYSNFTMLDLAEFADGVYLLRATGSDGEIRSEKIMVRH